MKVQNQSIFVGDGANAAQQEQQVHARSGKVKSVSAAALKEKFDPVAAKKQMAQKRAMKVVGDVFANDRKLDQDVESRREHIRKLQDDIGAANKQIKDMEAQRAGLREEYGVAADSQEEKDLQLLAKEVDAGTAGSGVTLTAQERQQLAKIKENGLTEYQKRSLEIKEEEKPYVQQVNESYAELRMENAVISESRKERLKHHAMVDAQEDAAGIMKAASKEIFGMLINEGKENIDKEMEERVEQAKEKAKEEKAEEEKLEKAREKKTQREELTEDILETTQELVAQSSGVGDAQQEIKDMMNKMNLLEEDIKGAAVDAAL